MIVFYAFPKTKFYIYNKYHPNLKFAVEIKENNTITFFDLTLIRNNNVIATKWYNKETRQYHQNDTSAITLT